MAVTADEYELPVAIADCQSEMAKCLGLSPAGISRNISRGSILQTKKFGKPVRLICVTFDEEDEDG